VHEIKHDGYRLIVRRDGETVRLFTRRRRDYNHRMDKFMDFNENSVLQLIAIVLIMAMFGCAVAVLDRWVWARSC